MMYLILWIQSYSHRFNSCYYYDSEAGQLQPKLVLGEKAFYTMFKLLVIQESVNHIHICSHIYLHVSMVLTISL